MQVRDQSRHTTHVHQEMAHHADDAATSSLQTRDRIHIDLRMQGASGCHDGVRCVYNRFGMQSKLSS